MSLSDDFEQQVRMAHTEGKIADLVGYKQVRSCVVRQPSSQGEVAVLPNGHLWHVWSVVVKQHVA